MKIYVVMKKEYDYNDQWDYPTNGEELISAFLDKNNALLEKAKLLESDAWRPTLEDGSESEDLYFIKELEVDESEVIIKRKEL